jgi:hypothetical protein
MNQSLFEKMNTVSIQEEYFSSCAVLITKEGVCEYFVVLLFSLLLFFFVGDDVQTRSETMKKATTSTNQ